MKKMLFMLFLFFCSMDIIAGGGAVRRRAKKTTTEEGKEPAYTQIVKRRLEEQGHTGSKKGKESQEAQGPTVAWPIAVARTQEAVKAIKGVDGVDPEDFALVGEPGAEVAADDDEGELRPESLMDQGQQGALGWLLQQGSDKVWGDYVANVLSELQDSRVDIVSKHGKIKALHRIENALMNAIKSKKMDEFYTILTLATQQGLRVSDDHIVAMEAFFKKMGTSLLDVCEHRKQEVIIAGAIRFADDMKLIRQRKAVEVNMAKRLGRLDDCSDGEEYSNDEHLFGKFEHQLGLDESK